MIISNQINESNILHYILIMALLAFIIAFAMTPVSIKLAHKIGAIDVPKDGRRMHHRPIPRFGGLAIYLATTVTMLVFVGNNESIRTAIIGGTLMYLLGAVDDLLQLKALTKFAGQTVIAIIMYVMGIRITFITNYFGPGNWDFGVALSCIVTIGWIVGVTNAINLMDGLDGLAAGIAMIIGVTLAYVAYIHGEDGSIIVCLAMVALAGACAGFLPYNFSPARTFMGDGGALFLGFMISIMSVISPLKRATFVAALVPILALAIPIFDTLFAIVRRLIKHEGIMTPDKGHIHHRIMKSGFGQRRSVLIIYGIVATMGMAAVMISRELYKEAVVLALIATMYLLVILADHKNEKKEEPEGWIKKAKPKNGEDEWIKDEIN